MAAFNFSNRPRGEENRKLDPRRETVQLMRWAVNDYSPNQSPKRQRVGVCTTNSIRTNTRALALGSRKGRIPNQRTAAYTRRLQGTSDARTTDLRVLHVAGRDCGCDYSHAVPAATGRGSGESGCRARSAGPRHRWNEA